MAILDLLFAEPGKVACVDEIEYDFLLEGFFRKVGDPKGQVFYISEALGEPLCVSAHLEIFRGHSTNAPNGSDIVEVLNPTDLGFMGIVIPPPPLAA